MGPGYDIVSLDLDGTLVDTADEIAEAANCALEAHGVARRPVAQITPHIGHGFHTLMRKLLAEVFLERPGLIARVSPAAVLDSADRYYADTAGTTAEPYDGVRAALVRLTAAGVRLACVTNKESRHAHRVLDVTGLAPHFALTIGGDTLPRKKPDPSVLQYVVRYFAGDVRRVAHVGDSSTDVEAARNAGVAAWAVPYGYNGGQPIAAAKPQRIFRDLRQMADYVLAERGWLGA